MPEEQCQQDMQHANYTAPCLTHTAVRKTLTEETVTYVVSGQKSVPGRKPIQFLMTHVCFTWVC